MKCIYCGASAQSEEYCRICGADLTIPRRIIRISNLLYNQGLEKAQVRDLSGAISCLKRSLKFNKENTDARNLLGLCYFETGEVVNALVEWVISNNLNGSDNLAAGYIRQLQGSKLRLDQYNTAIRKYNQSLTYLKQGNEDMAQMQLRKVVSQNPKFVRAIQLLALEYMHTEQWEKARGLLKKAARIDNTNTTTLRYLTQIEETTGKMSLFGRRTRPKVERSSPNAEDELQDTPREVSLRYMSGNDVIIAPTTFRDSSTVATFINIMLGILLGAAIVWFLTVPAIRQGANDKANKQVSDANTSLATVTATIQDLQDEVASANENTETAKKEAETANKRVESYTELLKVADLYVKGDQTKTVEALGKLNEKDFDAEGKQLYEDLTAMVGDALFNQYYTEGTTAYVAGNYEEAAKQLQMAIDSDESGKSERYYDALYYLGFAYLNAGNHQKADEVFQDFSNRYPDSASMVTPYMSTGSNSANSNASGSQGAASMDSNASAGTSSAGTSSSGSSNASTQNNIEIYSGTNQNSNSIAWTDPTTGQGYDMYGNPVYTSGNGSAGTSSAPQIAWTDPTTGQGYDMYGNPVYQ
ncbi:MAG TPA: hypothetical protein DHV42_02770 [Lachnospiraceae bacterium]|nr:hypothetical protein [Lachnospiraceae bacterium]